MPARKLVSACMATQDVPLLHGVHHSNAVDIRLAAGWDFVLIFVWHFLFAHVRCLTLFRAGRTRLLSMVQFQVGDTFSSFKEHLE